MPHFVEITKAAEIDIMEAYLWHEEQKEGLGTILEEHFSKAIETILYNPGQTQIRYEAQGFSS